MTTIFTNGKASWLTNISGKNCLADPLKDNLYVKFVAEDLETSVALVKVGNAPNIELDYSTDGNSWHTYEVGQTIALNDIGDFVMFRAGQNGNDRFSTSRNDYNNFQISDGKVAAYGNTMSLLSRDPSKAVLKNFAFTGLFRNCEQLTRAPELPAKKLSPYCYSDMFRNCKRLKHPPKLPATETAEGCCLYMFANCTNLKVIQPTLHSYDIKAIAYYGMLSGCTSLSSFNSLYADADGNARHLGDIGSQALRCMFNDCTSLTAAPDVIVDGTLGQNGCAEMFRNCISISAVPALSISQFDSFAGKFSDMFNGCTSITDVPADYLKDTAAMISNFSEEAGSGTSNLTSIYSGMFMNCTSLTAAPFLYECALSTQKYSAKDQYKGIFKGCTNLSCLSTDFTFWSTAQKNMLDLATGTKENGIMYCSNAAEMSADSRRSICIPESWTIEQLV